MKTFVLISRYESKNMKKKPKHVRGFCSGSRCWDFALLVFVSFESVEGWGLVVPSCFKRNNEAAPYQVDVEYDLVIIGAGASGLFASGAATMLGSKTLMLDVMFGDSTTTAEGKPEVHPSITSNIGGDCTNSACVPSKAVRSVARMAASGARLESIICEKGNRHDNLLELARTHATNTVLTVRGRENAQAMVDRDPNLDVALISDCHFVSPHELSLTLGRAYSSSARTNATWADHEGKSSPMIVRSKKFLIATGASPVIPKDLEAAAQLAGVPTYTYQTLLRPSNIEQDNTSIWQFANNNNPDKKPKRIVIAGGGATACELGQSLARLGTDNVEVDLIAPMLLRGEDATLQNAAAQLLTCEQNLRLHLGRRVENVLPNRTISLSDGSVIHGCDALILCLGRTPAPSLQKLKLEAAHVKWNETTGVQVKTSNLQSISAAHVYACGDCCSAVATRPLGRTATHAAWTGYFAAANTRLPRLLTFGSKASKEVVPRVVYTDPELVSIGLSIEECMAKYGQDGFDRVMVPTAQTDRADMELLERGRDIGFIELRATKIDGKILGMTACGPSASEHANELSVILENGLSAIDVARSLHSYPSHGYLLHRLALAIAFNSIWGSLEAIGTLGVWVSWLGKKASKGVGAAKNITGRRKKRLKRAWDAEGASRTLILTKTIRSDGDIQICSFLDLYTKAGKDSKDVAMPTKILEDLYTGYKYRQQDVDRFQSWLSQRPNIK
jgi:pyruvate/2-oxoglutarate dehydrogenase complex dihydrolipoamide dehydrogenase (E3) component